MNKIRKLKQDEYAAKHNNTSNYIVGCQNDLFMNKMYRVVHSIHVASSETEPEEIGTKRKDNHDKRRRNKKTKEREMKELFIT